MSGRSDIARIVIPATPVRFVLGTVALAVAGWFLWESIALQATPGADRVGPGAFPGLVSFIMAAAALALLLGIGEGRAQALEVERPLHVLATLAALVGFVIALGQAPMLAVIFVLSLVLPLIVGERRPLPLLAGAAGLTLAVWLLFGLLLRVPL